MKKYVVLERYTEIGRVDSIEEARKMCNDLMLTKNVSSSLVQASILSKTMAVFVYRYETLYYETFLIVSSEEYRG